jgi:formylglycine-generating enzyme required for sulfatase activity
LIPWIAGIDPDTGEQRRRVARLSALPTEARPLMDLLVDQRLLSTDVAQDANEKTVEPAHEALLRRWGLLQGWLAEDAGLLSVMGTVKRASRDWAANGKDAAWVTHSADRLRAAERLLDRQDLAANLEPTDLDYLAASRTAERAARSRKRRVTALVGVLLIGLLGVGWLASVDLLDWTKLKVQGRRLADIYMPAVLTPEEERALKPGDDFQECASCPNMVVVPAGSFMMGSPESEIVKVPNPEEPGKSDELRIERTQRPVTIANAFAVGKFEVTFDEWDACVAHGPCKYRWTPGLSGAMSWALDDKTWGRGRRPAIFVSWEHAKTYVAWLSKQTGKDYRLLSEAEWEYAARAVKDPAEPNTKYAWGDDPGKGNANGGASSYSCEWCGKYTAPVGQFPANAFGLHDMHGNVWELVEDCYGEYNDAPLDGSAKTSEICSSHVIRGGAFLNYPIELRSAYRTDFPLTLRVQDVGFRVARTLLPPSP